MIDTQHYVSHELTHFVAKDESKESEQYSCLLKILQNGWLTHPPHNPNISGGLSIKLLNQLSDNEVYNPQIVCFCDVPIADIEFHSKKYSRFGISFLKSFLIKKGVNPVFYVSKNSMIYVDGEDPMPRSEYYDKKHKQYIDFFHGFPEQKSTAKGWEPIPSLELKYGIKKFEIQKFLAFHLFSFVKFYDDNLPESDPKNYYMEREWRIIGNLNFALDDVHRIFLPKSYAKRFRKDMPEYEGLVTFITNSH